MLELFELLQKLIHEPIQIGTLIACALFLLDKIFKRAFIRHARKFLHLKSREDVELHMERLNQIDRKLNALLEERNIEWRVQSSSPSLTHSALKRRNFLRWLRITPTTANSAARYIPYGGGKMDKISKVVMATLVGQVCVILKDAFGITVGTEQQDAIATILVLVVGAIVLWRQRHKKGNIDNDISATLERSE